MVDDVRDITETAESKASQEVLDRARLARERREAEQRKRLDELRAHAAAAQAQREKRDDERRKRQAEQRARDDDRRVQVEERKRAIWEASVSRREALLQRERDRTERLERQRAARSAPRPAFAFGSSTPRLLEPLDSSGFFWAARRAASTTNVMFASAPLTRRASALHLDSDTDNKDEADRTPPPAIWSSVARRRTDLVPTMPAPRAPGRAYSMTRLDRLPASPTTHFSRTQTRSDETTPGSRPGSALSNATGVIRRQTVQRKPRPASIAGTGVNTPRGGSGDIMSQSCATTPSVSRDSTVVSDVTRRNTPRRPRPLSLHAGPKPVTPTAPGEGKPPLHRKPKPSKEHDKTPRGKSLSASPGRTLSPSPTRSKSKERSLEKEPVKLEVEPVISSESTAHAAAVSHKLEALQQTIETQDTVSKIEEPTEKPTENTQNDTQNIIEKPTEEVNLITQVQEVITTEVREEKPQREDKEEKKEPKSEKREDKREEKKEPSVEKTDDSEMTASMSARRITTEEQAKAALAERRRRAREELERQAEIERQRLQREAEEEAEKQRLEEERQLREEQEARELALLQRQMEEEKLRKAIEAQQQLERDEAERKAREELEKQAKLKEEEEKRVAAELAEKLRREEKEREEKERLARKQRVEAIMARTRIRKAEEDKKQQEGKVALANQPEEAGTTGPAAEVNNGKDNGNVAVGDLLGFTSQSENEKPSAAVEVGAGDAPHNNGNIGHDPTHSQPHDSEENPVEPTKSESQETNNGNINPTLTISANFIQNEVANNEATQPQKLPEKIIDDDFTTHNGHNNLNHPLTLQNAI